MSYLNDVWLARRASVVETSDRQSIAIQRRHTRAGVQQLSLSDARESTSQEMTVPQRLQRLLVALEASRRDHIAQK